MDLLNSLMWGFEELLVLFGLMCSQTLAKYKITFLHSALLHIFMVFLLGSNRFCFVISNPFAFTNKVVLNLIAELPRGPVGQILCHEKEVLVVEKNRLLMSPPSGCFFSWGFPDNSCAFGNYATEKVCTVRWLPRVDTPVKMPCFCYVKKCFQSFSTFNLTLKPYS